MKNGFLFIMLMFSVSLSVMAAESMDSVTIPTKEELNAQIESRSSIKEKYWEDKKLSKAQIDDYENLVSILNSEIEDLSADIANQKAEIEKLDTLEPLLSESPDVFERNLPAAELIPASLKHHYNMILKVRELKENLSRIEQLVEVTQQLVSGSQDVNSVIAQNIKKPLDNYYELLNDFLMLDSSGFSEEQNRYIETNLSVPYDNYIKKYFNE